MAWCSWLVLLVAVVGGIDGESAVALRRFEDKDLDTPGLVIKYGYPVETHKVTTSDGYGLTMFRIPYGRRSAPGRPKKVVLLQHGLMTSSTDWIIMGPEKALGYILADAGFDVWLGNARGNRYSREHNRMSPQDVAFWDWSWHEQALFDLPAMIDYILKITGVPQIYYVGHSMGNTMFYVLCSEKPEYNRKIRLQISLSPVAFMDHMTSPFLRFVSHFSPVVDDLTSILGIGEFNPSPWLMKKVGETFCTDGAITQVVCTSVLFLVTGFDSHELNETALPVLMGHTPAGASTRQILHYIQEIHSGHFRQYDYGILGNLRRYGTYNPPDYNINKIKAPVVLFYSKNDWLSHPTDVARLNEGLGNSVEKILVPFDAFTHMDYLYAINGKRLVYDKLLEMTKKY